MYANILSRDIGSYIPDRVGDFLRQAHLVSVPAEFVPAEDTFGFDFCCNAHQPSTNQTYPIDHDLLDRRIWSPSSSIWLVDQDGECLCSRHVTFPWTLSDESLHISLTAGTDIDLVFQTQSITNISTYVFSVLYLTVCLIVCPIC